MHQLLFKNRFNALVFVAIILFSVRILVGTDNDRGAIEEAAQKFGGRSEPEAAQQPHPAPRAIAPVPTEFTPEEELIDETSGLDPNGFASEPDVEGGGAPGLEVADSSQAEIDG